MVLTVISRLVKTLNWQRFEKQPFEWNDPCINGILDSYEISVSHCLFAIDVFDDEESAAGGFEWEFLLD